GVKNIGGDIDFVAGTGIEIIPDSQNKKITFAAKNESIIPGPHAETHRSDGSDPITPASIGAAAKQALDAHVSDGTQHAKTVRFVVGTSTSGWTEKDCDYLCDGTNDQVEINNAITALPVTGGEIVILDGTYNITATINVN